MYNTSLSGIPRHCNSLTATVLIIIPFLFTFSINAFLFSSLRRSILFKTTTIFSHRISPITRHSAVCVCTPLVTSTTNIIISIIWAPPIIVLIRDAWPGQSTSVNCRTSYGYFFKCSGIGTRNEEKPRSSVIPRSLLWGFLSNDAVEAVELRALARAVFPLSIWPRTPMLKFRTLDVAMLEDIRPKLGFGACVNETDACVRPTQL